VASNPDGMHEKELSIVAAMMQWKPSSGARVRKSRRGMGSVARSGYRIVQTIAKFPIGYLLECHNIPTSV